MSRLNEAGSVENHAQTTSFDRHHHHHQLQQPKIYPIKEGIRSAKTVVVYERCFNQFLNHIKIYDLQVLLDFSPKVIKQMLVDYVLWLRDGKPGKKLSRASIKVHLAAILHFFQINNDDFNLTIRNFRIHLPSDDFTKDDRPYTTEEIQQVIRECDLRSKVVIHLLCSTGMRMGALHSLQISDLTPMPYQGLKHSLEYSKPFLKLQIFLPLKIRVQRLDVLRSL